MLNKNVQKYPHIHSVRAAVWDKKCILYCSDDQVEFSMRYFQENNRLAAKHERFQAYPIEILTRCLRVSHWDFVKIDVEGIEAKILTKADDWIGLIELLAMEIHDYCRNEAELMLYKATMDWQIKEKIGETYWRARCTHESYYYYATKNLVFSPIFL